MQSEQIKAMGDMADSEAQRSEHPRPPDHEWARSTNAEGKPLLAMHCVRCGKRWNPSQTLQQMGKCKPDGR